MGGFTLSKIRPGRRSLLTLIRSRTTLNDNAKKANDDSVKAPAHVSCSSGITEVVKNETLTPVTVSDKNKTPAPPADDDIDSCSSTEASSIVTYESSNDDSTLSSIHSTSLTSFAQNLSPPQIEFLTYEYDETLTQAAPSASIICRGTLKKNRPNGSSGERGSLASSERSPQSQSSYHSGSVVEHLNELYKIRKQESEDSSSKSEGPRRASGRRISSKEADLVDGPREGGGDKKRGNVRKERRGLYEM